MSKEDCPIARAFKSKGFQTVHIAGYYAHGDKSNKRHRFDFDGSAAYNLIRKGKPFTLKYEDVIISIIEENAKS